MSLIYFFSVQTEILIKDFLSYLSIRIIADNLCQLCSSAEVRQKTLVFTDLSCFESLGQDDVRLATTLVGKKTVCACKTELLIDIFAK